jgi:hypothetical protein
MSRKNSSVRRPARDPRERLENWLHAAAFLTVRRQMRGKWLSRRRSS